jgi:hypothetical protein
MQGQHGQQIGIDHHPASGEELVDRHHDPPLETARRQRLVDEAEGTAREAHQQMPRGAVVLQRQRPGGQRMVAPHHDHILPFIETLVQEARRGLLQVAGGQLGQHAGKVADRQVDLALLEQLARIARRQRQYAQRDSGRLVGHDLDQAGRQLGGGRIGHRQHEMVLRLRRIEGPRGQRVAQLAQRIAHRGPERERQRRGLDAIARAAHQVVADLLAQAPQRIADRRLGGRQVVRGAGEVALGHHLVEHAQQVEVQGTEVELIHIKREYIALKK